ncbi:MAG: Ltp family lipoprotein [Ruminiclostridium sp.]|nr:Ltp family lipoprotein [Ruminiclostridium sp.]
MFKKAIHALFLCIISLILCSCGSTETQEDLLVGTWYVTGVQTDNKTIHLSQNAALADLYDTHILTVNSDGTYSSMEGMVQSKGTWSITLTKDDSRTYTFSEKSAGLMRYDGGEITVNDEPSSEEYWVGMNTQNPDMLLVIEKDGANFNLVYGRYEETPPADEEITPSTPQTKPSQESTIPTPSITRGEQNALETAKGYLRSGAFSYSGLIDQLEYEGYTYSEAVYGADHCGADWYEQAAQCAEEYLDVMSFSRQGLIDQLEYEGFTYDQAVYGVDQVY